MKLLADHFEDWHDILEVSVSDAGIPVALSYRVKHTLGLMLFDHTQVSCDKKVVEIWLNQKSTYNLQLVTQRFMLTQSVQ